MFRYLIHKQIRKSIEQAFNTSVTDRWNSFRPKLTVLFLPTSTFRPNMGKIDTSVIAHQGRPREKISAEVFDKKI